MPAASRGRGTNEKPWREALQLAANEIDPATKHRKLRRIAQAVVDAAIAGDMQAAKEIGDRLDGKPRQEIDAVVEQRRYVARIPQPAKDTREWMASVENTKPTTPIQ